MWAHYASHYKGICLEFRTEYEPFNKIRRVRYDDKIPKIDLLPIAAGQDASQLIESLFCTKSRPWSYEQEWRCFHSKANTLFGYPAKALKAVYFGPRIDPSMLDLICLILAGQNPNVELWVGRRSEGEFKLVFENKIYTPYIIAERVGMTPPSSPEITPAADQQPKLT
jgi:hypothetical protein